MTSIMNPITKYSLIGAFLGTVIFAFFPIFGLSLVPGAILAGLLLSLVLWQSRGFLMAVASGVLLNVWILTASQYVIALCKLNGTIFFALLWLVMSLLALTYLWIKREQLKQTSARNALVWLLPGAVGVLLLVAFFANIAGATNVGLTWAMSGDSPTFVTQARDIANLGKTEIWNNAVPIPPALAAMAMISGRDSTLVAPTLEHDVTSYALVWILGIALSCWAAGAVVVALLRTRKLPHWVLYVSGIGASVIPLTWFYAGYATWFGFFNSTIALCVLLMLVLAFINGRNHPLALLGVYFFSATTMFLVWSPLVIVPVSLGAFIFFSRFKTLWKTSNGDRVFALVGFVQLVGYALSQALPLLFATQGSSVPGSSLLALTGAAIYFRPIYLAAIYAGTAAALLFALWKRDKELMWGFLVMILGLLLGFGYMIYGSGQFSFPWLYYPSKFIWIGMMMLIPIALGSVLAWLLPYFTKTWTLAAAVVAMALMSFIFFKATAAWGHINGGIEAPTMVHQLLIEREVTAIDQTANREVAAEIFALEKQDHLRFLWKSGNPSEEQINYWMLKMWSISDHGALRLGDFTYGIVERNLENLCGVLTQVNTTSELVTAEPDLKEQLAIACPAMHPIITQVSEYRP